MKKPELKALGESAAKNKKYYMYRRPRPSLLERFPTPKGQGGLNIHIEIPEFTSLCPITNQPDWATIVIDYQPDDWCVESKSLKLYKEGYRLFGEFHEACCKRICSDLVKLLSPISIRVEGRFVPRGGVMIHPVVSYFDRKKAFYTDINVMLPDHSRLVRAGKA